MRMNLLKIDSLLLTRLKKSSLKLTLLRKPRILRPSKEERKLLMIKGKKLEHLSVMQGKSNTWQRTGLPREKNCQIFWFYHLLYHLMTMIKMIL